MAVFKCKMCGGTLNIDANTYVAECEYCGTRQTLPSYRDEKVLSAYEHANGARRKNDFDKAMDFYSELCHENPEEPEAYWGKVLCKYGIEYVEDPKTLRRIPTVNRAHFSSILEDEDYLSAVKFANDEQKEIYVREAERIDKIQKSILNISQREKPFDVFLCYKESDSYGKRTEDSVLANDIYNSLTKIGYKVFYSRISLEDKLGTAYEPYIFAALNSAQIMFVVGTKPEYMQAVWVKNEWSRYLKLIKKGEHKILIPIYKNMQPNEMPEELKPLQSLDFNKLGAMQDLIHFVEKNVKFNQKKKPQHKLQNDSIGNIIERSSLAIEERQYRVATEFLDKAFDLSPKNPMIYVNRLLIETDCRNISDLKKLGKPFDKSINYQRAMRYADDELKLFLDDSLQIVRQNYMESAYKFAMDKKENAKTPEDLQKAIDVFSKIPDYKDSKHQIDCCNYEQQKQILNKKKRSLRRLKISATVFCVVVLLLVGTFSYFKWIFPQQNYDKAEILYNEGKYDEAYNYYHLMENYKDAKEKSNECLYIKAVELRKNKQWDEANKIFKKIEGYKDSANLIHNHKFKATVTKKPTCTESGVKTFKCDCGETYTEVIKPLGHNFKPATCTEPKKCTRCGKTEGSPLGHDTSSAVCSRCGKAFFKTQKYSGHGAGHVSNINLPKGKYNVTFTHDGNRNFVATGFVGEYGMEDLFVNEIGKVSYVAQITGPRENDNINIKMADGNWTITIEAIG